MSDTAGGDRQKGPLEEMSDKLTEQSDVIVENVSFVVTKGPDVEGNEVTIVAHHGDESSEDDILLGFDAETFEKFAGDVATNADHVVELFAADKNALEHVLEEAEYLLDDTYEHRLRELAKACPDGERDE